MGWKGTLRRFVERHAGLYVSDSLPRGIRWDYDVRMDCPDYLPSVIFDVGANVGQSAQHFLKQFPKAQLHSFEPIPDTYKQLERNVEGLSQVKTYCIALGSESGVADMGVSKISELASLVKDAEIHSDSQQVTVSTLDKFCGENGISHIDYLKVDTEGFDLHVLMGGRRMLSENCINFVETEVSISAENTYHVPLDDVRNYLEDVGFRLYALYEQVRENDEKGPFLRRVNAAFINVSFAQEWRNIGL